MNKIQLIRKYLKEKKPFTALEEVKAYVKKFPKKKRSANIKELVSDSLLDLSRFNDAKRFKRLAKSAVEMDETILAVVYLLLAQSHDSRLKDIKLVLEELTLKLKDSDSNYLSEKEIKLKELTKKGLIEFEKKQFHKAIVYWEKILSMEPDHKETVDLMYRAQEAIELQLENEFVFNEGLGFFEDENYEEAIREFKKILSTDPSHEKAKEYLKKCNDALIDYSGEIELHFSNAVSEIENGNLEEAVKQLRKVLDYDSEHNEALEYLEKIQNTLREEELEIDRHMQKALAFVEVQRYDKAIDEWKSVLEIDPNNKEARDCISKTQSLIEQDSDEVEQNLEQLDLDGLMDKALTLYGEGKYSEAIECWKKILKIDPYYDEAKEYIELAKNESENQKKFGDVQKNQFSNLPQEETELSDLFKKELKKEIILEPEIPNKSVDQMIKLDDEDDEDYSLGSETRIIVSDHFREINKIYDKAIREYEKQNFKNAIKLLEDIIEKDPVNSHALMLLDRAKMKLRNSIEDEEKDLLEEQQEIFEVPLLKKQQRKSKKFLFIGLVAFTIIGIISIFVTFTLMKKNKIANLSKIAIEALNKKDYQTALDNFSELIKLDKDNEKYTYNFAIANIYSGNPEISINIFEELIKSDPTKYNDIDIQLARAYFKGNKFIKTKELLNKLISKNIQDVEIYQLYGVVEYKLHHYQKALKFFQKAEKLAPLNDEFLEYYASANMAHSNTDEALNLLKKINNKTVKQYLSIGQILVDKEKFDEAEKYYNDALNLDKSNFEIFYGLARLNHERATFFKKIKNDKEKSNNFYKIASKYYKQTTELNQKFIDAFIGLGTVLLKIDDFEGSIGAYNSALKVDSTSSKVLWSLGVTYHKLSRESKTASDREKYYQFAEEQYKKALSVNPDYAEAFANLAYLYYSKGFKDKAKEKFLKSIQINPDQPNIQNILKKRLGVD